MAREKELTPADIESGIYTLSDLERTLGGSRLTWRKFIKQKPEIFELVEIKFITKIYKTTFTKLELQKMYKEMISSNRTIAYTGTTKNRKK